MPENARMWVEVVFNVVYLAAIWALVSMMARRRAWVAPAERAIASRFMWAFALLALGDTGHVGFRVLAYALGGLDARPVIFGIPVSLVGLGALATAYTVTLFYVLMLDIWRLRFRRRPGGFEYFLFAMAVLRLVLMAFPQNEWWRVDPVPPWSLLRNAPLTILGLGMAYLILRDAKRAHDRTFTWIGAMIVVSYTMYVPVILFALQVPVIGMLMIPKTLAYLAVALMAFRELYTGRRSVAIAPA
jgi:hypothetical protein